MNLEYLRQSMLGIVTMHGKESILSEILSKELGMSSFLVPGINTDVFGTFSGEIKRLNEPLEVLRMKCELGKKHNPHLDLFMASEGSFGNHPEVFFAKANEEIVMIKDFKNETEYLGRHLTTKTNYNSLLSNQLEELMNFATTVGFPEHGVLIGYSKNKTETSWIKDISSPSLLHQTLNALLVQSQVPIHLVTDMRAHRNPTRREAIAQATNDLVKKIRHSCPQCNAPYFVIREAIAGLPCKYCNMPTKAIAHHIRFCATCTFSLKENFPNGRKFEDPMYCDFCNP